MDILLDDNVNTLVGWYLDGCTTVWENPFDALSRDFMRLES